MDADHGEGEKALDFNLTYTDKISHHQVNFKSDYSEFELRSQFLDLDLLLINGNHFLGDKQIVIINEKKKESLSRKLDRLKNVVAFVFAEGETEIYDFLKEAIKDWKSIPTFKIRWIEGIATLIRGIEETKRPKLKGLVLAGGKSLRMGKDKTKIDYHGKPQNEYIYELISGFCEETYLSVAQKSDSKLPQIEDKITGLGPYSGIVSAFIHDPNAAWLVLATDIPLLNKETINQLVGNRNTSKYATCFHNPETNFPEPLITIWEPRSYPRLLNFLSLGFSCPRKALINSDVEELEIENKEHLFNANTPEEMAKIRSKIDSSK
ncbi:NTP transferase domain-containing protein [Hyphobacterium sp. CCMP332]|nr:NTP transferase domain-containing protein [Hyphobacterium sp. CCMP332]